MPIYESHTPETATVANTIVKNCKLIYICHYKKATPQRQLPWLIISATSCSDIVPCARLSVSKSLAKTVGLPDIMSNPKANFY